MKEKLLDNAKVYEIIYKILTKLLYQFPKILFTRRYCSYPDTLIQIICRAFASSVCIFISPLPKKRKKTSGVWSLGALCCLCC